MIPEQQLQRTLGKHRFDMKKKIPKFETEAEERRFWQEHDSSQYLDWSVAEKIVLPKLRPSGKNRQTLPDWR